MLHFKSVLLLTKSKKPILVKTENIDNVFIFSYKDKNHKVNYEQYTVDLTGVSKEDVEVFVRNHFQKMLDKFNSTLRTGESKRTLLNVYRISQQTFLNKM